MPFTPIPSPPSLHILRFISAYFSFIENGFAVCLSSRPPPPRPVHGIYNTRNAQLQSTWPLIGPASWTEQYFRLVYTTPAVRKSICRLCTGKYRFALVFRYSILFTIKSVRRHRCVGWPMVGDGACVWAARGQEAGRREREREGVRYGLVFDGARESWVFAAIKRAYLIKPGPELMGQQPLSPLWNSRIYQWAEVARSAKDFPIVTGFSEAFSFHRGSSIFGSSYRAPTKRVDKFDRVKMHFHSSGFFFNCRPVAHRVDACARNSRSKLRVAVNDE